MGLLGDVWDATGGKVVDAVGSIGSKSGGLAAINPYVAAGTLGLSAFEQWSSAKSAEDQRDWSEQLANTAVERRVADLKRAGLNPALAYGQGGAAVPSTAPAAVPRWSQALASAAEVSRFPYDVEKIESEVERNLASAGLSGAQQERIGIEMTKIDREIKELDQAIKLRDAQGQREAALAIGARIENMIKGLDLKQRQAVFDSLVAEAKGKAQVMQAEGASAQRVRELYEGAYGAELALFKELAAGGGGGLLATAGGMATYLLGKLGSAAGLPSPAGPRSRPQGRSRAPQKKVGSAAALESFRQSGEYRGPAGRRR